MSTANGEFANGPGAQLLIQGNVNNQNATLTVADGFVNAGTIELQGGGCAGCGASGASTLNVTNGTLVNAAGASIKAQSSTGNGGRNLNAVLDNQGLLQANQAMMISKPGAMHGNSGTIDVNQNLTISGATSLQSNGVIDITTGKTMSVGGAALTNEADGIVTGAGTLAVAGGLLTNAAVFAPGSPLGILSVTGQYPQTTAGGLTVELGGLTAGTQYDRLTVSGLATLAGDLNVELVNGFVPSLGNSFLVLTYSSRIGQFNQVNGLLLPNGLELMPSYGPSGLTLTVVDPQP